MVVVEEGYSGIRREEERVRRSRKGGYIEGTARTEKQNYKSHLGGNVYCTITEGSACMDIRQYWKPQEEVIPT